MSTSTSLSPTTTPTEALRARGIFAPLAAEIAAQAPVALITAWCDYVDQHPKVGTGALVAGLRRGDMPPSGRGSLVEEQARYAERIAAWLRKHFPDMLDDRGRPHPAAVVAVIHLHWRHGKGQLTKGTHGSAIEAAVARWDELASVDEGGAS